MSPFRSTLSIFAALLALGALSGCGFQLRGAAVLPPSVSPMLFTGAAPHDLLRVDLENLLADSGVQMTTKQAEAKSILQVQERKSGKRILSVDQHGKVAEYELNESVRFRLTKPDGSELVPQQQAIITRSYVNTGGEQLLGKQSEELLLRTDMQRDLTAQIMRRLEAQLRSAAPARAP